MTFELFDTLVQSRHWIEHLIVLMLVLVLLSIGLEELLLDDLNLLLELSITILLLIQVYLNIGTCRNCLQRELLWLVSVFLKVFDFLFQLPGFINGFFTFYYRLFFLLESYLALSCFGTEDHWQELGVLLDLLEFVWDLLLLVNSVFQLWLQVLTNLLFSFCSELSLLITLLKLGC